MADVPILYRSLAARSASAPPFPTRSVAAFDVAVVGAGVVGLSVAWTLAARGLRVALLEAGEAGQGTSAAASGMLAAAAELEPGGEGLLALGRESQSLWPLFREAVEVASGLPIDYRSDGTLVVAVGRDEVERLRFRHELQRRAGLDTHWLGASEVRAREPSLKPAVSGGIFCPDDGQVDPPRVLAALRRAFVAAGGTLLEHEPVDGLDKEGGRYTGVASRDHRLRAETTVLAVGAGLGMLPWLPPGLRPPVRPLKGQAMALRSRAGPLPLGHVVWTADIHLAPKGDGRLILGATVEEAGFDAALTAGGALSLLDAARRVLPGIEELAIDDVWAGFRPTSDDDAPVLGELAPGLLVAGGHHRNGYLLAPVTAAAIADIVTTGQASGTASAFGPLRFALPSMNRGAA